MPHQCPGLGSWNVAPSSVLHVLVARGPIAQRAILRGESSETLEIEELLGQRDS